MRATDLHDVVEGGAPCGRGTRAAARAPAAARPGARAAPPRGAPSASRRSRIASGSRDRSDARRRRRGPSRCSARRAITSFAFMFVEVPEPVWNTSTTNCASWRPSATSRAACSMARARGSSSTPSSRLAGGRGGLHERERMDQAQRHALATHAESSRSRAASRPPTRRRRAPRPRPANRVRCARPRGWSPWPTSRDGSDAMRPHDAAEPAPRRASRELTAAGSSVKIRVPLRDPEPRTRSPPWPSSKARRPTRT